MIQHTEFFKSSKFSIIKYLKLINIFATLKANKNTKCDALELHSVLNKTHYATIERKKTSSKFNIIIIFSLLEMYV